jgi:hypothetical protein
MRQQILMSTEGHQRQITPFVPAARNCKLPAIGRHRQKLFYSLFRLVATDLIHFCLTRLRFS